MAALEALGAGIPVAAAKVGALPDVILPQETGFLFAAGDVAGAARAVKDWASLADADQAKMARACRKSVELRFGPDEPVSKWLEIYDRLMGSG